MKVDNPAQLEKVSNCIERCQKLQRLGPCIHSMRPREQLLRDIQDDLKYLSQMSGRSTLTRSHTTVEDKHSKKKSMKQRRSSVTLAKIKEEGEPDGVLSFSSSLPRGVALSVSSSDSRKVGVLMRSASASAGSSSGSASYLERQLSPPSSIPRKGVASKPGLSTISASPRRAKKRSPTLRRRSPRPRTPDNDDESPVLSGPRKSRTPKLAGMKEVQESTEYAADDEGVPDLTSLGSSAESPITPGRLPGQQKMLHLPHAQDDAGALAISNAAKTSSPFQTKKKVVSFEQNLPAQQLVTVEVHCNDEAMESEGNGSGPKPVSASGSHDQDLEASRLGVAQFETSVSSETYLLPEGGSPKRSARQRRKQELEVSRLGPAEFETGITSETCLLPEGGPSPKHSARQRIRKRSKSPSIPPRKKSLSQPNVRGDERDRLIELHTSGESSPYIAWESQPGGGGSDRLSRKAYSLDRKTAIAGNSAAQRGGKSLYDSSESDQG